MMDADQLAGLQEGYRRLLKAYNQLVQSAIRRVCILRGQRALLQRLLCQETATGDDVRTDVNLPLGIGPNCLGAVPSALARVNIIDTSEYAKSCRPTAHNHTLRVWRLVDRRAAEQWLLNHPDRSHPTYYMPRLTMSSH
jgi:hypothetical protein